MGDSLIAIAKTKLEAAVIATWALAKDKIKTSDDVAHPAPTPKPDSDERPAEPPAK